MKKFLLICLTALCSLVTQGLWAQDTGSIYWALSSGGANQTAVGTPDGLLTSSSISLGDSLEFNGTSTITSDTESSTMYGTQKTFTLIKSDAKLTDDESDDEVDFKLNLADGYTFTPTSVSFYALRSGTDNGWIDVYWIPTSDEKDSIQVAIGLHPNRDKTEVKDESGNSFDPQQYVYDFSYFSYDISSTTSSSSECCLRFYLRSTSAGSISGKSLGLSEITITGTVTTPTGESFEITVSPADNTTYEFGEKISEITITSTNGLIYNGDDIDELMLAITKDGSEYAYADQATSIDNGYTFTISKGTNYEFSLEDAGTYVLTIPEKTFTDGNGSNYNESTTVTWTINEQEVSDEGFIIHEGIAYEEYDATNHYVQVVRQAHHEAATKGTGDVVIPSTFDYQSTTYTVKKIGYRAFYQDAGLTSLDIPETIDSIGGGAMNTCNNLTSFICRATTPPAISSTAISSTYDNAVLYVPCGEYDDANSVYTTLNAYRTTSPWMNFLSAEQSTGHSGAGIHGIDGCEGEEEDPYFDLTISDDVAVSTDGHTITITIEPTGLTPTGTAGNIEITHETTTYDVYNSNVTAGDVDGTWVLNLGSNAISESGDYTIKIPLGFFKDETTGYTNHEATVEFEYSSTATAGYFTLTFDPADEANVTELSIIKVTSNEAFGIDTDNEEYAEYVEVKDENGNVVAYAYWENIESLSGYAFEIRSDASTAAPITAPGTYTIEIPEGFFINANTNDVNEIATATYTINGFTIESATAEATDDKTVTLTLGQEVTAIDGASAAITITYTDASEGTITLTPAVSGSGKEWTLTLTEALSENVEYTVNIPAGYFESSNATNNAATATFEYTAPIDDTFALSFDPESGEKVTQLDYIYVTSDDVDQTTDGNIVANNSSANVYVTKEGEDDPVARVFYDTDQTLSGTYAIIVTGLSDLNTTPITDPGTYTIEIPDEWLKTGITGRLSKAATLTYTIEENGEGEGFALTLSPEAGDVTLNNLGQFGNVTITAESTLEFGESYSKESVLEVTDAEGITVAYGILDGVEDNVYTYGIYADEEGTEGLWAPTESGDYTLTIPEGFFQDDNNNLCEKTETVYTITIDTPTPETPTYIVADGIVYTINEDGSTVSVAKQSDYTEATATGEITIPESVTDTDGNTYSVTTIATEAFKDNTDITSVVIPATVTSIEGQAFYGCTSLESITCLAITPPTITGTTFGGSNPNQTYKLAKLYVPCESVSTYKSTANWSSFLSSEQDENGAGAGIYGEEGCPETFDLDITLKEDDFTEAVESIELTIAEDVEVSETADDIIVTLNGETVATATASLSDGIWTLSFDTTLEAAGTYSIVIPYGYFIDEDQEVNDPITISFTIEAAEEETFDVTIAESAVTSESVTVTITVDEEVGEISIVDANANLLPIVDTTTSEAVDGIYVRGGNEDGTWYFYFVTETNAATSFTTDGTYTVAIPQGYFTNEDGSAVNAETSFEFTIGEETPEAGDYPFTFTPESGSEVTSLSQIIITNGDTGLTALLESGDVIVYDAEDNEVTTVTSIEGNGDEGLDTQIVLTLEEEITETGEYKVVIPANTLFNGMADEPYAAAITLTYTVAGKIFTINPAEGEVEYLESIELTYDGGAIKMNGSTVDTYLLDEQGNTVAGVEALAGDKITDEDGNTIGFTFGFIDLDTYEDTTISTPGTYTITIPVGAFLLGDDETPSPLVTITYTIVEPSASIDLLDEVEDDVFAITKSNEWFAENGFDGTDPNYSKLYDAGVIFYENDNITIETATSTWVANNGYQLSQIQAMYPDYTAYINFGSGLDEINEQTTDPTEKPGSWQGMLKVTPKADGGLTYNVHAGGNIRTFGIYDVEAEDWVTIDHEVTGDVVVYGLVEQGKEYLLVGTGTNSNLYQIAFPADEPEVTEPEPEVEGEVIYTTDFTDWTELDLADSNGVEITAETTTGEEFTFTLWGVSVNPGDVSQYNDDDTPKFEGEGALIFAKYDSQYSTCEPYVVTSTISSVTKIVFTEAVTGSNRGVKISVMGDGDEDWVEVFNSTINSGSTEQEVEINRTNCQIKIESINPAQNTYILDFTVYGVVPAEEEALYATDFTDWETIDRTEANGDEVTVATTTGGNLTFTLWGVGVDPTKTDESKFPDYVGAMITAKYAEDGSAEYSVYEPFAVTSTLGTVDKIVFTQVATGNNRGIKVSVKGDGDEDWEVLYNETIHTASGETIELDNIGKTNCRIKFESFALAQNGYIADLKIYGTDATGETEDPDEQLYEDIKMEVDALGVDLTYAWANINLEYPESVEGLQSTYDAIKEEIANLQLVVEASHDGEELTADQASIEAQVEVIKAEIDALTAAAASINSITIDNNFEGKSIYTISGQKVSAPTKAGIYIIDGKKVVIK